MKIYKMIDFLNEKLELNSLYSKTGGRRIVRLLSINDNDVDVIDTKGKLSGKKITIDKDKFKKDFYKCILN